MRPLAVDPRDGYVFRLLEGEGVSTAQDAARDPRIVAAIMLIERAGAQGFQLRYSDDNEPLVWMALGEWAYGWDVGAGRTPVDAAMRLLSQTVDGGQCAHCGRPTGVTDDWRVDMPLADQVCWYVYDPETERFRRSCEGETEGVRFGFDRATGEKIGRNDLCPCGSGRKFKICHGA